MIVSKYMYHLCPEVMHMKDIHRFRNGLDTLQITYIMGKLRMPTYHLFLRIIVWTGLSCS